MVEDAEKVENLLAKRIGLTKQTIPEFKRDASVSPQRVRFGEMSEIADKRACGQAFRYAKGWTTRR